MKLLPAWNLWTAVFLCASCAAFGGDWTTYTAAEGLADNAVNRIVVDPSGVKWFGTENGLSRFDGAAWTTYRTETGISQTLAGNRIFDIAYETGWGPELWIGTDAGVSVMGIGVDGATFATPYTTANRPLVSNRVQAVAVDSSHVKWFGTNHGVSLFNGTEWDSVPWLDLSSMHILNFAHDKNTGMTYVGTKGGGVSRIRLDAWDAVTSASPYESAWAHLPTDTVRASFVEENGWQWFGTEAGLCFHRESETKAGWTFFTTDSGMADHSVESITRDRNGLLWVGTQKGVSSFDGVFWKNLSTADGLAGEVVNDIAVDRDGSLWFATENGVSHYTGNTGSKDRRKEGPARFALLPNYPNPFNPSTTIPFFLGEYARVTAEVFDCQGRKIATLADQGLAPGIHRLSWNAESRGPVAPTGVYLVTARAQGRHFLQTQTRKIVLVK
jgi:ligand-binding sensor domain-containing protein